MSIFSKKPIIEKSLPERCVELRRLVDSAVAELRLPTAKAALVLEGAAKDLRLAAAFTTPPQSTRPKTVIVGDAPPTALDRLLGRA